MNQIARGGDDPTPPEGGTTRVPQTSQSQGPAPSLPPNLQGDSPVDEEIPERNSSAFLRGWRRAAHEPSTL